MNKKFDGVTSVKAVITASIISGIITCGYVTLAFSPGVAGSLLSAGYGTVSFLFTVFAMLPLYGFFSDE